MKYIISGTNRPNSRTLQLSRIIQGIYKNLGEDVEIISLEDLPLSELRGEHYANAKPKVFQDTIEKINTSEGLIMVIPEYNGSMPGALKYFIDHWTYPLSFEYRPVCFVGLGGMFGGLRPVEHLQHVFGYRNAFMFPDRVFIREVFKTLNNGELTDTTALKLLEKQAKGFQKFVRALSREKFIE